MKSNPFIHLSLQYAYNQNLVPYLISQVPNIQYGVFWSHQSSPLRKKLLKHPNARNPTWLTLLHLSITLTNI